MNYKKIFFVFANLFAVFIIFCFKLGFRIISIPCVYHTYFGVNCPGCGITRSIYELSEFNILKAFWYNPVFVLSIIPIFIFWCLWGYNIFTKKPKIKSPELSLKLLLTIAVILVVFFVFRNTAFYKQFFY